MPRVPATNRHSDDYRCLSWNGTYLSVTAPVAIVAKKLWENFEQDTPEVGGAYLLVLAEARGYRNLPHLLASGCVGDWKRVFVPGETRGSYRLAAEDPGESTAEVETISA